MLPAELAERRARLDALILDLHIARDLAIEQMDDREARVRVRSPFDD